MAPKKRYTDDGETDDGRPKYIVDAMYPTSKRMRSAGHRGPPQGSLGIPRNLKYFPHFSGMFGFFCFKLF